MVLASYIVQTCLPPRSATPFSNWGRAAPSHILEIHRRPNNEDLLLNLPLTSCDNKERFPRTLLSVFWERYPVIDRYLSNSETWSFDVKFGPSPTFVRRHRPDHKRSPEICRVVGGASTKHSIPYLSGK